MSPPIAEGLTAELDALVARARQAAETQRFGSDFLLLMAEALTIGADQCAALWGSLESTAMVEAAQALRDLAPDYAGDAARNPTPMES